MQIVTENLTYTYNRKSKFAVKALDNISLTIEDGSFFGIFGHTGSGKSTFIQHLNGLIPVESGKLLVGDVDMSAGVKKDKKKIRELRSKLGMIFQYPEYQLFASTVFEDVAFGFENFFPGKSKEEVGEAVRDAIEIVGLPRTIMQASPFDLSGGQKRRVAIAGILVTKPQALVLDEPVAGLDPVGKKDLMRLLHELKRTTCKNIIIVSHDMDEVADNCDGMAVFSEGKIVMKGTPNEIYSRESELKELRLDVPLTAYVENRLEQNGIMVNSNFKTGDFIEKVAARYGRKG